MEEDKRVPALLITKRTYGRDKNNMLLYKCIPDDKKLEPILIPYTLEKVGFSKVCIDLYVIINYTKKKVIKNIGLTNNLENYTKYQLFCKNIDQNTLLYKLPINYEERLTKYHKDIEDRTDWEVFSIDGEETKDYDDAFSIKKLDNKILISVYISNVPYILDILSYTDNIWEKYTERVSTVYLPTNIITMFPQSIVELGSLTAGKTTCVLTMDILYQIDNHIKEIIKFSICKINPYKNHVYESKELYIDPNYVNLLEYVKSCIINDELDSYKIVEFLMRKMCFESGKLLYNNNIGVFRTINEPLEDLYPSNCYTTVLPENMLPYAHITSPIRRIVDILNQIKIQQIININLLPHADVFYNIWIDKIEYINSQTKKIKRVQNDCALLYLYPTIKDKEFLGKILNNETVYDEDRKAWIYTVFLKELHLISQFTSLTKLDDVERKYKLYMFDKKASVRKKILLQLIN